MKPRWILPSLLLALAVGCKAPAPVHSPADGITDAIADASAKIANNVKEIGAGKHLGFDTNIYPGDEAMRAWRDDGSPYEWVGYYLPAPCHKDASWSGKRATLTDMGWGLAVIYVGQQTWEDVPTHMTVWRVKYVTRTVPERVKVTARRHGKTTSHFVTKRVTKRVPIRVPVRVARPTGKECSRALVAGARGAADAADAIAKTVAEGFPNGSVIFLDLERMQKVPESMRDYYHAWTARVLADGRYRPGYYAHTHNAERVYADVRAVFDSAGAKGEPQFWIAGNSGEFSNDRTPKDVGHAFASAWQGLLDVVREWNGVKLPIDVSVAAVPSPSSHEYAVLNE